MFGSCFYSILCVLLALQSSVWGRESLLLYFNCLPGVLSLFMFCGSSSWCRGLFYSVLLWYFMIILTCLFSVCDTQACANPESFARGGPK